MNYYLLLGLGIFGFFILLLLLSFRKEIMSLNPFSLNAVRSHKNLRKLGDKQLVRHYEKNTGDEVSWNNRNLSKKQRSELITTLDGFREEDERLRDRMLNDYDRETNSNDWKAKKKTEIDYNDENKPIRRTVFEKAKAPMSIFRVNSPRRMSKKSQIAFMRQSLRNSDEFKDVDVDSIDFSHEIDSSLSYSENYESRNRFFIELF